MTTDIAIKSLKPGESEIFFRQHPNWHTYKPWAKAYSLNHFISKRFERGAPARYRENRE